MFSDYEENTISSSRAREFGEHLRQCEACSTGWREFSQTIALLRELPEENPPADLLPGIHARLTEEESHGRWFKRLAVAMNFSLPLPAAVGIFALAMLAAFLYEQPGRMQQPQQTAGRQHQATSKPMFALSHDGIAGNRPLEQITRTALATQPPPDIHHRLLSPDIHVLVKNSDRETRMELCREIIRASWHVHRLSNDLFLIHLPREDLSGFRRLFKAGAVAQGYIEGPGTTMNNHERMLTAAIRFD